MDTESTKQAATPLRFPDASTHPHPAPERGTEHPNQHRPNLGHAESPFDTAPLPPLPSPVTAEKIRAARVQEPISNIPVEAVQPATAETAPTTGGNEQ